MKKYIILSLLAFSVSHALFSQGWQPIDITSQNLGGIRSMVWHKGKLFAVTYNQALMVSSDAGNTFTDITTDTLIGVQEFLIAAGNRLYLTTWRATRLEGRIYYTEDEGKSWVLDTAGLFSSIRPMYIYSYNNEGYIIAQFQGNDAYYRRDMNDAQWYPVDTFYRNNIDPLDFTASHDTLLANTPNGLWYSTDNALSWTALGKTGLPAFYNGHGFDFEGGRIYFVGKEFQKKPRLWYSDDFGTSWDTLAIASYFDTNAFGTEQVSMQLKAVQNQVWISLQNEASNTVIDVIHSTDRGNSWAHDTSGLHNDPFGTDHIGLMITHHNTLYAHTALGNAYKRELNNSIGLPFYATPLPVQIYPNPAVHHIEISVPANLLGKEMELYTSTGLWLQQQTIRNIKTHLPVYHLESGVYIVRIDNNSYRFLKLR